MTLINCMGIFGMAFGLLVTAALFVGYLDEHRINKDRPHDAEDGRAL
jgi:hypothetical protein